MTREEQRIEEAKNRFSNDQIYPILKVYAFIEGARWADEHPNPNMVNKQEFIENTVSYFTPILKTYCSGECVKELITGFVNPVEK